MNPILQAHYVFITVFSKNNMEKSKKYDWDIIYKKYMEVYTN